VVSRESSCITSLCTLDRPRSCSTTPPTRSCCALSPPTREFAAIGLAILWDRSGRPLFPRWSGYIDLDVAAIFAGGAPVLFVKQGAFGWDRAIAFWAVLASFGRLGQRAVRDDAARDRSRSYRARRRRARRRRLTAAYRGCPRARDARVPAMPACPRCPRARVP
jgi:hypothetical protein